MKTHRALRIAAAALVLGAPAAGHPGELRWRGGWGVIFALLLFGMFIPYQSVLIPLVRMLQWAALVLLAGSLKG